MQSKIQTCIVCSVLEISLECAFYIYSGHNFCHGWSLKLCGPPEGFTSAMRGAAGRKEGSAKARKSLAFHQGRESWKVNRRFQYFTTLSSSFFSDLTRSSRITQLFPIQSIDEMTKRRRERDRPKAGPDAAYDPSKRLHLSYGDEDEGEEEAQFAVDHPAPVNYPNVKASTAATSNTHSPSGGQKDDDQEDDEGGSAPEHQRARKKPGRKDYMAPKPALGSWRGEGGEDSEDNISEEDEAMAYLKAVRTECQGLPTVLRAGGGRSDADLYKMGDSRGYVDDDCYIARPVLEPQRPKSSTVTAMEAYTELLKRRFEAARAKLWDPPVRDRIQIQAANSVGIPRPDGSQRASDECVELMRKSAPMPAQLCAMAQDDVLGMLELIQKHFFKRGETLGHHVSTWIWSLLARLDIVGTMDNDEVFVLRDLGKRALVIQISFNNAAMAAQLEDLSRAELASNHDITRSPQHEGQPPSAATAGASTDNTGPIVTQKSDPENTLATLDMIVTIVGEFFGQRDLLDSRRSWDPEA